MLPVRQHFHGSAELPSRCWPLSLRLMASRMRWPSRSIEGFFEMHRPLNDGSRSQFTIRQAEPSALSQLLCGRRPATLFITCTDLRANPSGVAQCSVSDLLVMRSAGTTVAPYDVMHSREAATIEYVVGVLKVANVVICGHTDCSVVRTHAPHHSPGDASVSLVGETTHTADAFAAEQTVRLQMTNLRTHPAVIMAEDRGYLAVHGWVYEEATGQVSAYEPYEDCFARIVRKYAA